jgi:transcriptional regulator with XRE-family HTH domain
MHHDGSTPNALQALIAEHLANTGDTIADVAERGGLPRQTVSALLNKDNPGGMPRRSTLERLATGLGLSAATVIEAAAMSAGRTTSASDIDHRVIVLGELARTMPPRKLDVLLATARALQRE